MNRPVSIGKIIIFLLGGLIIPFVNCRNDDPSNQREQLLEEAKLLKKEDAIDAFLHFKNALLNIHPGVKQDNNGPGLNFFLDSLRQLINDDITDVAFYRLLRLGVDRVGCSHSYVEFPELIRENLESSAQKIFLPLSVYYSAGRYRITNLTDSTNNNAELLAIDGKEIPVLYNDLRKFHSCDANNPAIDSPRVAEDFSFKYFLAYGSEGFSYTAKATSLHFFLKLRKNNIVYFDTIEGRSFRDIDFYTNNASPFFTIIRKPLYDLNVDEANRLAILSIRTFDVSEQDREAFENFIKNSFSLLSLRKDIKSLVIDIRDNTGGYNELMARLASYTLGESFYSVTGAYARTRSLTNVVPAIRGHNISTVEITNELTSYDSLSPGLFSSNRSQVKKIEPSANYFRGKIFILVNHLTGSAASHFAALHNDRNRALIVGEETEGLYKSSDSYYQVELPLFKRELFKVILPLIHLDYDIRNNRSFPGRGVIPDHVIPLSLEDADNNRDTQLNFVLENLIGVK